MQPVEKETDRGGRAPAYADAWPLSRRKLLAEATLGFGSLALAHLLARDGCLAATSASLGDPAGGLDLRPRRSHFPARATSVIMLLQVGGPSQVDLFDPKPELSRRNGQTHPGDVETLQNGSADKKLMASPFRFRQHGRCGMELSELLPQIGTVADDVCLVRSMFSDNNNHPQAMRCLNTGKIFPGRPALGSWIGYALGTENENLPAYVVLRDPDGYNNGGTTLWENGWLPALFRGTEIQSRGAAVLNLRPSVPLPDGIERNNLRLLARLNDERRRLYPEETELDARIRNYELAARMQTSAEKALDIPGETAATRALYGLDNPVTENFGTRCLMARRMVESGVRFVQVTNPIKTGGWDHHSNIKSGLEAVCPQVDQPTAALIHDLKRRGLLETTIVIWTGEFGRLPISQGGNGRDHNRHAFSLLLAGGGFRPGHVHGASDEFGYRAVESPVSCPDLLATILRQLGLDHDRLKYRHHGREETLTDPPVTGASVVEALLA
ncbi:MAG TPA: DUF1501 domain-containing protein [Pirellulales bacterium]|jgi:hypothetical protein|nr:DUF1501 domain-containing protein [Pirellulales bacterium]